ncbi:MAG: methylenetetrahydrofolate reductase [Clostridiales Family XIII bacterium]|jgi:methylenetetrahydrofolate reductase (NADPH)|nr:methylenetetrahydrofolate reductase [Clostridiales Family XIII bacterium]
MKISEIFKNKMTFSFEVFPPKEDKPMEPLLDTLARLYRFEPDFISCTYGAGGTNKGRSIEVCEAVKKSGNEIMTHFTCIGNTREDIKKFIKEYIALGIENVLVMRGDFPEGWEGTRGDFAHADELLAFLRAEFPGLCMAAAGYPEKHVGAASFDEDIAHLRSKQDNGAQFIMTQLCHDVDAYEDYAERIYRAGVDLPVVAGVMPVLAKDPIIRMTVSNGCSIPAELAAIIGKYEKDPDGFKKAGKEYTVKQIHRFMAAGIGGLHIYALNKYEDVSDIVNASGIRTAKPL